jgi:hypothetical protein
MVMIDEDDVEFTGVKCPVCNQEIIFDSGVFYCSDQCPRSGSEASSAYIEELKIEQA